MEIPKPEYDYCIERLVAAYKWAVRHIRRTLRLIDVSNMTHDHSMEVLKEIAKILAGLNEESKAWVAENIPEAVRNGTLTAWIALGVKVAKKMESFNRLNRDLIEVVVADTQSDLLAVTQNISRKVRMTIRQVTAESMRENLTRGISGRQTINHEIVKGLRKKLGDAVDTGIVDSAGRRWNPSTYVDMVTRTKMTYAHREATINEAVPRKAYYGVISHHGGTDACRKWEGRVVKLIADAPGDYPYMGDLPRGEIFHPNCRHVVTPLRDPQKLTADGLETGG